MKQYISAFLLCGLLIQTRISQAEPRFALDDPWSKTEIHMPAGHRPLPSLLQVYSQTAKVNVFADMTGLATNTSIDSPTDLAGTDPLSRRLGISLTADRGNMNLERTANGTYVLWPKPDLKGLTQGVVKWQQIFDAANPSGDRASAIKALKTFYEGKGWNSEAKTVAEKIRRSQGLNGALHLSDFPKELQGPLLSELVSRIRALDGFIRPEAWTDDYWKSTRVRLELPPRKRDGKLVDPHGLANLYVFSPLERFNFFLGHPQQTLLGSYLPGATYRPRLATRSRFSFCAPVNDAEVTESPMGSGPEPGFTFDPTQEASLQKQVTFVHQSDPTDEVIADLAHQSGTPLTIAPDVAPASKTLAISQGMPLWAAMEAVARLYNAHWSKVQEGYALQSDHLDELHTLLSRMGESAYYQFLLHSDEESAQTATDLANQIVDAGDATQLQSQDGLPLSSLPNELQQSVITFIRESEVGGVAVSQQRIDDALASNFEFRFVPRPPMSPQFFGAFFTGGSELNGSNNSSILAAYTPDGRYITQIFPELAGTGPSLFDEAREKRQRDIEEIIARQNGQEAPAQ